HVCKGALGAVVEAFQYQITSVLLFLLLLSRTRRCRSRRLGPLLGPLLILLVFRFLFLRLWLQQVRHVAGALLRHLETLHSIDSIDGPACDVEDSQSILRHLFSFLFLLASSRSFALGWHRLIDDKARISGELHPSWLRRRSGGFGKRIDLRNRSWHRTSGCAPLLAGFQISNNNLTVAIFRSQRISHKFAVRRKRLSLNQPPAVVVIVSQRTLLGALARNNCRRR